MRLKYINVICKDTTQYSRYYQLESHLYRKYATGDFYTIIEECKLGLAIRVVTRWHDSKTTRISWVRVGINRGRSNSGNPKLTQVKTGRVRVGLVEPEHGPFFSMSISGQMSYQFYVNSVSISDDLNATRVRPKKGWYAFKEKP